MLVCLPFQKLKTSQLGRTVSVPTEFVFRISKTRGPENLPQSLVEKDEPTVRVPSPTKFAFRIPKTRRQEKRPLDFHQLQMSTAAQLYCTSPYGCVYVRRTETTCVTPTCVAPRHVDVSRDFLFLFSPNERRGGGRCQTFSLFFFFPVQQTTSGIGHRVK